MFPPGPPPKCHIVASLHHSTRALACERPPSHARTLPPSLAAQVRSAFWSSYKHLYTVKWLLDLLSCGAFYWISEGNPGSISDPKQV